MTPRADVITCYICKDKRRTADTDASLTPTHPHGHSETLKQTLIRALSHGRVDETEEEEKEGEGAYRVSGGVCVVSLRLGCDGELEAMSERVTGDSVIICRRCTGLLKDFEHHEQMTARKAEEIRHFLMRQMEEEEEEGKGAMSSYVSHSPQDIVKRTLVRNHSERQGIMAAFKALRKTEVKDIKGRGRKRKNESILFATNDETKDNVGNERFGDPNEHIVKEESVNEEEERRQEEACSARHSERIQRRREDGLVMRWGDDDNEDDMKVANDGDFHTYSPTVLPKERSHVRRGRGRKITRVIRSVSSAKIGDEKEFKYQCPFCFRYYTPMNSRIHNCTSYKNQLRCQACNIFFTSYVRLEKHLEVMHFQQKHLSCPEEGCNFMCIAEPTLVIHKHFHVLESYTRKSNKEGQQLRRSVLEQQKRGAEKGRGLHEEVTVEDDEYGVMSSPEIADQVSFLIDEKSFQSNSNTPNITMDRISEDEEDCKVLRFQSNEKNQEKPTSPNARIEAAVLTPEKGNRRSPKGHSVVVQCPVCDMTLASTKSYQEHLREVHNLRLTTKKTAEDSLCREVQKEPHSESLMRIVKYYNVKKNSNITLKVMD